MSEFALTTGSVLEIGARRGGWVDAARRRDPHPVEIRKRLTQRPLGEIMVMLGLIGSQDRDAILEQQERLALPFGECAVRLNLVSAEGLSQALAYQFGSMVPAPEPRALAGDLVTVAQPMSAYADALRAVSGRLMSRWIEPGRNVIAVASAGAGEGRSHVAANLAVSFAQAGLRTLLVDADLRRPRQHLIFGVSQHPGLSRLLCGFAPGDVVHRVPQLENLMVITSGPIPPDPAELLGRHELAEFMTDAGGAYDVVLVDTPAAKGSVDAELIATAAGGALIVTRKSRTRQRDLHGLAEGLARNGVQLAGTLLSTH